MDREFIGSVNDIRNAIEESFQSDYGGATNTNMVDIVRQLANAITPNIAGNKDATGGHVESLTEAVMGMTGALVQIASAIEQVAEAMAEQSRRGDDYYPDLRGGE